MKLNAELGEAGGPISSTESSVSMAIFKITSIFSFLTPPPYAQGKRFEEVKN